MVENKISLRIIENGQVSEYEVAKGTNLLKAIKEVGIIIPSPCGGVGKCGKCKVLLEGDSLPEPTPEDINLLTSKEIREGYRLACKVILNNNLTITQDSGFKSRYLGLGTQDSGLKIGHSELRTQDHDVLGLAIDIGTTTVAMYLVQLDNGEVLKAGSSLNSQVINGADVISRIHYIGSSRDRLEEMRTLIISGINSMIDSLLHTAGIDKNSITKVVVSGNTIMLHLLLGLNVEGMGVYPYIPVTTEMTVKSPQDAGIEVNPKGEISILPSVSAFIGADTLSGIVATGMYKSEDICLLIDLGTNGEMVLGNKDRLIACSAAMGPAFEGANIEFGTASVEGAIDKVIVNQNGLFYSTILNATPIGICGSGVIDAVAELLKAGVIDFRGRMLYKDWRKESYVPSHLVKRMIKYKGQPAFVLVEEREKNTIVFTQQDIRQVQLAKAAVSVGISALMEKLGVKFRDIKKVYLAGGFGSFINIENAVKIGLIPEKLKGKIFTSGNTSAIGAIKCLVDPDLIYDYIEVSKRVEYFDLNSIEDFQDKYVNNINFRRSNSGQEKM